MAVSLENRIREREAAEQALRQSEETSRRVFRDAAVGMVVATTTGRFLQVNQAYCDFLGYTETELKSMTVQDVTHPDDWRMSENALKALLSGKTCTCRFIKRYLNKIGETLWGEVSISFIADATGNPGYFVAQIMDVTERVQAEEALLKRNQQLQVQSRAAQEINRDLEMPLIFRRLVEAAMELTGATAGAAGLVMEGQMVFTEYNEGGSIFPIDYRFKPGKGVPGWVMQNKRPYLSNEAARDPQVIPEIQQLLHFHNLIDVPILSREEKLLGCFEIHNKAGQQLFDENDVELLKGLAASAAVALENAQMAADRLRTEVELKQQHARLEQANRTKDEFIAMLSHELRTPLTPVLTCIDSYEDTPGLSPEIKSAFELIRRNVQLEARLIDDLLDVARVTFGKADLHLESVDAHRPLRDALEICRPAIGAKKLTVTLDLHASRSRVMADSARLQQVVWNLINNAVKFTPASGSILIRTHNNHARELVLEFTDNGEGIDPGMQTRIFDPFEQGRRSFGGGLGLGLAIAKGIVDAHGGRLTAHSRGAGKGSTFRVVLKTCAEQTGVAFRPDTPGITVSAHPQIRIFLVEDHEDTRLMITKLLIKHGYRINTATGFKDAMAKVESLDFNLLICDVGLPDGNGLDLMRQLRSSRPDLNGISISGYGMEADVRKSRDAGFAEHLVKPVTFSKLESAILKITASALAA
jgi:PAS domain S-box-containing protein